MTTGQGKPKPGRVRLAVGLAALVAVLLALGGGAYLLGVGPWQSRFVEYPMPESLAMPVAIAAAPDGTIWFTMDLAKAMGRVRNGRLERLPTADGNVEPVGLGAAADGSAWYTDNGARGISHMSPLGEIASFPLDTPIVRLGRLTVAPDGAVWFAEGTGYSITRLKDGAITRHVFESPRGDPYGVAVAPDGVVWATLRSGDQLLRIAPDGDDMKVVDVPRQSAVPTDIAVGRDGAIWFIESRDSRIARFKEGKFDEFPVPGDNPLLSGLVVTPDDAVWFGMLRTGSLGRLRNGSIETFKLPREGARPYTLAADRDGNVWYADITGTVGMLQARYARK
jgi:virginiamycin B lyase